MNQTPELTSQYQDPGDDLQILSFFHYAMGVMIAMTALIPATYYAVGVALADPAYDQHVARHAAVLSYSLSLGWTLFLFVGGFLLAGVVAWGGWCMHRRTNYRATRMAAFASCIFVPLGTVLGAASLSTLGRPEVRALFDADSRPE